MVTHQLKPSWTWLWMAAGFALLKPGPVHPESSGDTSSCSWGLRELGLFPTTMIFNHALQSPGALVESSLRLPLETGRRFPIGFWKPALLILLSLFAHWASLLPRPVFGWMHSMTAPFVFRPTFALIGHCVCSDWLLSVPYPLLNILNVTPACKRPFCAEPECPIPAASQHRHIVPATSL